LFRRQFAAALCYLSTAALVFPAQYAAEAMKGNTFLFVGAAHDKVAEIYRLRHPVSGLSRPGITDIVPGLIALGEECGPPVGCECWIAWDRAHNRGIEEDLGHWHRPKSSVFRMTRPDYFAIVNVRRIDDSAYSVSGCTADWSALWIR
jgi:hypothetical protein